VARIRGKKEKPFVLILHGHLDTVPPAAMAEPFSPRVEGNRLYGRGACDMKSGFAAMLAAFKEAGRSGRLTDEIYLTATTDEEFEALRIKELMETHLPKGDLALIAESTGGKLGVAHKGALWGEITFQGRAGHASRPEAAVNAIYSAAKFIEVVNRYNEEQFPKRHHDILGHPTMVVGVISGGTHANIVPDSCVIDIDKRYLFGESEQSFIEDMERCFALCQETMPAFKASVRIGGNSCPPFVFPLDNTGYARLHKTLSNIPGLRPEPIGLPYWGEGGHLGLVTPVVYFGPGVIEVAHSNNEYVELESLFQVAYGYRAILREFCCGHQF